MTSSRRDGLQAVSHEYWSNNAPAFDRHYKSGMLARAFLSRRTQVFRQLLGLRPDMVVADVGCGSGIQLALLAPHVKEIVGFDFSEDMVRLARHRVESQRIPNATVVQCDARAIKAGSATFDAAYCLGLLDNMPAPADTLSERNRIVKQAGEIVFTVPKRPSLFAPLRWGPGLWVRRHLFSLPPVLSVLSLEQLRAVAGSAGIDVDQVSSVWTTMWIAHGRTRV